MAETWGTFTGQDFLGNTLRSMRPAAGETILNSTQQRDLRRYLLDTLPPEALNPTAAGHRATIQNTLRQALHERIVTDIAQDVPTLQRLYAETLGLGILEPLLQDESISSVTVNGPGQIMIERLDTPGQTFIPGFEREELERISTNLARRGSRTLSDAEPILDLCWDDPPTRVHINALNRRGTFIALRRGRKQVFRLTDYLSAGRMNKEMIEFLTDMMQARLSVLVTGVPGTGKTTFLEALLHTITPEQGHVVVLEESPELNVAGRPHISPFVVPLRRPGTDRPVIGLTGLTIASLRMNSDILAVGEIRGPEAGAFISVLPGYKAAYATVHGASPAEGLDRLIICAQMGGGRPPSPFEGLGKEHLARRALAGKIQVIVSMKKLSSGKILVGQIAWMVGLGAREKKFILLPIFSLRERVEEGRIAVEWERNTNFHLPQEITLHLAMSRLQSNHVDDDEFQRRLQAGCAARESGHPGRAAQILKELYAASPDPPRQREILTQLRLALLAQPELWAELETQAGETKEAISELLGLRAGDLAAAILEQIFADPFQRLAVEEIASVSRWWEDIAQLQKVKASFEDAKRRIELLLVEGAYQDAWLLIENTRAGDGYAPSVVSWLREVRLNTLQLIVVQLEQDTPIPATCELWAGRILRGIAPADDDLLYSWAVQHAGTDETTLIAGDQDTTPDALYRQGCTAMQQRKYDQAREFFAQCGEYKRAEQFLAHIERVKS